VDRKDWNLKILKIDKINIVFLVGEDQLSEIRKSSSYLTIVLFSLFEHIITFTIVFFYYLLKACFILEQS